MKAAGGEDDAARREIERLPAETGGDADAGPVLQVNPFHLRLVVGHDTEALAMAVERIHQGAAAAEEEGVGAPTVQGDGQRILRSEDRRAGKGWVRTGRFRWSPTP